jgi:hypothetical protein
MCSLRKKERKKEREKGRERTPECVGEGSQGRCAPVLQDNITAVATNNPGNVDDWAYAQVGGGMPITATYMPQASPTPTTKAARRSLRLYLLRHSGRPALACMGENLAAPTYSDGGECVVVQRQARHSAGLTAPAAAAAAAPACTPWASKVALCDAGLLNGRLVFAHGPPHRTPPPGPRSTTCSPAGPSSSCWPATSAPTAASPPSSPRRKQRPRTAAG